MLERGDIEEAPAHPGELPLCKYDDAFPGSLSGQLLLRGYRDRTEATKQASQVVILCRNLLHPAVPPSVSARFRLRSSCNSSQSHLSLPWD